MLVKAIGDLTIDDGSVSLKVLDFIGTPSVALLAAVLVAMLPLGRGAGMRRERINDSLGSGLPALAGIMLIVAAGGGFKQMLVDAGVGRRHRRAAPRARTSRSLLLGWLVAVGIRLATGSATVATITAAGIVARSRQTLDQPHLALLVARDRCRLAVLQPRQRRRVLAGQGVLRDDGLGRRSSPGR